MNPNLNLESQARSAAERELQIARRIQLSFLPSQVPQPAGWEVLAWLQAAREVAGDFYDVFELSNGKRLGIVIADVVDKGVGAALFMALFRSLIRAFADQHYSLGWMDVLDSDGDRRAWDLNTSPEARQDASVGRRRELLSTGTTALKNTIDLTNNYIVKNHGETNMFATLFFGILDPARGSLIYINGGHEPPILIGQSGVRARLDPTGPVVGLFQGKPFSIQQVTIEPGEVLFAYTDGVVDARDSNRERFSEERLLDLVHRPRPSARELLSDVQTELQQFTGGAEPYDDITLLVLRRESHAGE